MPVRFMYATLGEPWRHDHIPWNSVPRPVRVTRCLGGMAAPCLAASADNRRQRHCGVPLTAGHAVPQQGGTASADGAWMSESSLLSSRSATRH